MRRLTRILGTLMIIGGAGALAWALTVWQWQDPFTYALQRLEQRELGQRFDRRIEQISASEDSALPEDAIAWRKSSQRGDAIARLRIPRLGLSEIVVNGTDRDTLKRGPGRYLDSAMPGEGELVYVAGHRTTYGAPFSRIDRLSKGDRVFLELPYGTFEYAVTGQRVVRATDTKVLESKGYEQLALQACHPRFFATHRLIAYAKVIGFTPPGASEPTTLETLGYVSRR